MTDYTWPAALIPNTSSLTWHDNTAVFESPLSGTVRTEARPGGRWRLSMTFNNQKNIDQVDDPLHVLEGFLFRLNGREHRAIIQDHAYIRTGAGGGTPVVNGANQTGLTLDTNGWPALTAVLYAGDRIGVSNQILVVVADVVSSPTGEATITVHSAIRTAPAHGAAIEIDNPTARFILANKAGLSAVPGVFKNTQLEFEEAIP